MALVLSSTTTAKRFFALALGFLLALTFALAPVVLTAPAAAAAQLELDAGTFTGTADVRKAFEFCDEKGNYEIKEDSPGLGLPDPEEKKNAYWGLRTDVVSVVKGNGALTACGFLTAMVDAAGQQLGAACGASKGWNGFGTIDWEPGAKKDVTQLSDIGWKVSVGGTLPVTANMVDPSDKSVKIGFLEATVQAFGGAACLTKNDPDPKGDPKDGPPSGATEFEVVAVYEAVRHHGKADNPPKKDELPYGDEKKEPHPPKDD